MAPKPATKGKPIHNEDLDDPEGKKTEKAKWDDKNTEEFLKACVEQVLAGNRPRSHLTKEGWNNVRKKFRDRTGHSYGQKQLKNRWDALKKEFSLWAKLVQNETSLG